MRIGIDISSSIKVQKHFKDMERRVKDAIPVIIKKSLLVVEEKTKREAPVDTGRLRASISEGLELFKSFGRIGPTVTYAKYVELGTRFSQANPFMERGAERSIPPIRQVVTEEIKQAIK